MKEVRPKTKTIKETEREGERGRERESSRSDALPLVEHFMPRSSRLSTTPSVLPLPLPIEVDVHFGGPGDPRRLVLRDEEWSRRPRALIELLCRKESFFASLCRIARRLEIDPERLALCLAKSRLVWPDVYSFLLVHEEADGRPFEGDVLAARCPDVSGIAVAPGDVDDYAFSTPGSHTSARRLLADSNGDDGVSSRPLSADDAVRVAAAVAAAKTEGIVNPVRLQLPDEFRAISSKLVPQEGARFWNALFHRSVDAISVRAAVHVGLLLVPLDASDCGRLYSRPFGEAGVEKEAERLRRRTLVVGRDWKELVLLGEDRQTPTALSSASSPIPRSTSRWSDWGGRRTVDRRRLGHRRTDDRVEGALTVPLAAVVAFASSTPSKESRPACSPRQSAKSKGRSPSRAPVSRPSFAFASSTLGRTASVDDDPQRVAPVTEWFALPSNRRETYRALVAAGCTPRCDVELTAGSAFVLCFRLRNKNRSAKRARCDPATASMTRRPPARLDSDFQTTTTTGAKIDAPSIDDRSRPSTAPPRFDCSAVPCKSFVVDGTFAFASDDDFAPRAWTKSDKRSARCASAATVALVRIASSVASTCGRPLVQFVEVRASADEALSGRAIAAKLARFFSQETSPLPSSSSSSPRCLSSSSPSPSSSSSSVVSRRGSSNLSTEIGDKKTARRRRARLVLLFYCRCCRRAMNAEMTSVWETCGPRVAVVAVATRCAEGARCSGIRALVAAIQTTKDDDAADSRRRSEHGCRVFVEDATDLGLRATQRLVQERHGVVLRFALAFVSEADDDGSDGESQKKQRARKKSTEDVAERTGALEQTVCPTIGIASPRVVAWTARDSHEMAPGGDRVLCCCVAGASV